MFVLVYLNQYNVKRLKARRCYLPKGIIENFINANNFYDQLIDSDIKWYKEIKKLTIGQGYTTGCLLDYDYIQNPYRLIVVNLSKKNNQMLVNKQFNKQNLLDNVFLTILWKIKETRLNFSQGSVAVL